MATVSAVVRARLFGYPGKVDRVGYVTPWGLKVSIHPLILEVFTAACEAAYHHPWKPLRIDSYNPRPIRGKDGTDLDDWSLHASALAFDFFATPPNVPPPGGVWTPDNPVPRSFAAHFTDRGFRWDATFDRVDLPHIEWASGLPPAHHAPAPPVAPIEEDDMPPSPAIVHVNGIRFAFVLADEGIWWDQSDDTEGWRRIPGGTFTSSPSGSVDGQAIEVAARGTDGATWVCRRSPQGAWGGWVSLGGKS